MNSPVLALPLSAPVPGAEKKKPVLLIDTSPAKRDLRAEVLRKLGMDVDCAVDMGDLVLMNLDRGRGQRDKFCDDLRSATPPRRLAFLVGRPEYLADSPHADGELTIENPGKPAAIGSAKGACPVDRGDTTRRWGILEASWRISAVRFASITRAMRALPPPPQDSEERAAKPSAIPISSTDLLKEELR